ncbi:MAG: VOC family protein [Chloroflexota bacterium]|nr:VOC family protein [Chloroflexota bacterium]
MDSNGNARVSVPRAIGYVALWTDRPEVLRDFFEAVLRYEVAYEDESIVVFDMDGETDLIIQRVDVETRHLNGTVHFGLYVEDIGELTEKLRERGASFDREMVNIEEDQFITILNTPTGHTIDLVGGTAFGSEDEWESEGL